MKMESRKRKKRGRARPHRLLRATSLLSDRAGLWYLYRPSLYQLRPFTLRAGVLSSWAVRAGGVGAGPGRLRAREASKGAGQDGSVHVPGVAAGLELWGPAGLRAAAPGESAELGTEGRGLGARLTVVHCNSAIRVPYMGP